MRGFLAGVVAAAVIGGFFIHLNGRYQTLDACRALQAGLTAAVVASVRADAHRVLDQDLPDRVTDLVLQPLAEPLIAKRVALYLADFGWFGCAAKLLRLDFLGAGPLVEEVRSVTLRL
ncbi:MAG: hypothetical protein GC191_03860 [Azospirillum sp.]|nr:hypothetical protein [Azospirillum sp.]